MSIFEFQDYKKFVLAELSQRPKGGRGEFLRIAKALNIHTTMVTHIFRGDYHLTLEQALALAEYFGLSEFDTEYLVALIQLARAADERAKKFCKKRLRILKEKSLNLSSRLQIKNKLDEKDQAIFYSSWIYSAIRLLTAIPKFDHPSSIARALNLNLTQVNSALEFLVTRGLVIRNGGQLSYGELTTYANRDSQFAPRHNLNWRLKVIERLESISSSEMAFTNAIVISEADFEKVTEMIVMFIDDFRKISAPSSAEVLCCLNLDWIKLTHAAD